MKRRARSWTRSGALAALIVLLVAAVLAATVWLAANYERNEQESALIEATESAVAHLRARLAETENGLQAMAARMPSETAAERFGPEAHNLLAQQATLLRIEWRAHDGRLLAALDSPEPRARIDERDRAALGFESTLANHSAMSFSRPVYSRPHFVRVAEGLGFEITELAVPWDADPGGALLAIHSLPLILDRLLPAEFQRAHQVHLSEVDGSFVARNSTGLRGAGVYTASVPLELPGVTLLLRANSLKQSPRLMPNVLAAMLVAVTLALAASGLLLWRDTRRRIAVEQALREQHAFRKAMEDALVTGLCARDLQGRITYVNPAFCEMTGFDASELVGAPSPLPASGAPCTPAARSAVPGASASGRCAGREIEIERRDGARLAALVFEAPLLDEHGRQTGWMDSVLDVTERRRVEELNRRQQEKLQAHARLALLGEVASALSHELNQPLAAIMSYASACENLLPPARHRANGEHAPRNARAGRATLESRDSLRNALERIRSQAERAGGVIRSVQSFVRRRHLERRPLAIVELLESIEPLIRLQARKWQAQYRFDVPHDLRVLGDRTMLEQALLNLTRNAAEAMEGTPGTSRIVEVAARRSREDGREWLRIDVCDRGRGVERRLHPQLFTAFFTTKPDGLGMGLSLCRSVAEAHGGQLRHACRPGGGSVFTMLLPPDLPARAGAAEPRAHGAVEAMDDAAEAAHDRSEVT